MANLAAVADMVRESEKHAEDGSADRLRAVEYYGGVMRDVPFREGRSSVTTREVRSHIKKVLPSIVRTIFGSDEVVEFIPVSAEDEESSQQATDYINRVTVPETDLREKAMSAIHDALLVRNGIIKWWWEDRKKVSFSRHTGLTEDALAALAGDDGVEVLESTARIEDVEGQPLEVYDVRIKRTYVDSGPRVEAVPRENFLIHPDAVTLESSLLVGDKTVIRRGDLVSLGYDPDVVAGLPVGDKDDVEQSERRDSAEDNADEADPANDEIDYYDLYVRVDLDGDGIAELRHMVFAGGTSESNLLDNDECDEVQFCDIKVMSQPHQWEGISLFDDIADIQKISTVLVRQTLDNLYATNNPQPTVNAAALADPDAFLDAEFGKPIEVKDGYNVRDAVQWGTVPFVADKSFAMLEYMDKEAQDRTGISDAASGLAPDALQNMTAKASAMIEQAGIGQVELMVREVANGLKVLFRGLNRLIIRHQDVARTVRLRNEWVQFDPRQWNADMDCTVNTGLGAGTRERDMMMMQLVMGVQEKLLAAFGPENPFVTPENLWESVSKLVESAGLKTPTRYFTEPDPQQVQALMEAKKQQPSPEQIKAQAEQQKLAAQMQLEDKKMQVQTAKEKAQMDADLTVKQAEIAAETQRQANELESKASLEAQRIAWEREKFEADLAFRREQAEVQRQDEIWKAQAAGFAADQQEAN